MSTVRAHVGLAYEDSGPASDALTTPSNAVLSVAAADGRVRDLVEFAIIPEAGDNCAIARAVTPKGTLVRLAPNATPFALSHTILEGHRFAIVDMVAGTHLLSWGLTFGEAVVAIAPGDYIANSRVVAALKARGLTDLPATHNFDDLIVPHLVDPATFIPSDQVPLFADGRTFEGFPRAGGRGIGTRNYIIVMGTTAATAGFVKNVEAAAKKAGLLGADTPYAGLIDGIVAVAHTEGAGFSREAGARPNNHPLLLDTLVSFAVHPNVAAALVVDYGSDAESVWGEDLKLHGAAHGSPLAHVPHAFTRLSGDTAADVAAALAQITAWLPAAAAAARSPQPLSALSIAQQCGGSDAFSGVSGNPCAGEACKLLIQHGGQAVLAETDELMGAEAYVLERVKDLATAQKFLGIVDNFKERLAWHGQSAESNPSGGNNWRGLYNIGLKSLGAAKKKHADVRLDGVLAYSERSKDMGRGYYMMDSPGNDLESIAGQVATGCNLIYFITGNGSITNFPFVPTIKIVTTTERFKLLEKDMDFNAGRYQEGTPMPVLGAELFERTVECASGVRSVGEKAGHAQVSLWRNWNQTPVAGQTPADVKRFEKMYAAIGGAPLSVTPGPSPAAVQFSGYPSASRYGGLAAERIGLILPTSLCSGEVARKITLRLNAALADAATKQTAAAPLAARVTRFECLPHTEGCGTGYAEGGMAMYSRIMVGHLTHPSVSLALCLEHGCEKTHNDFFANAMVDAKIDGAAYGYASIQLDGGIDAVTAKVEKYFSRAAASALDAPGALNTRSLVDARGLDVGVIVPDKADAASPAVAAAIAALARALAAGGGCLVVPATSGIMANAAFTAALALAAPPVADSPAPVPATLAFGETVRGRGPAAGVHVMDMPYVRDFTETVTGFAAAGVHAVLVLGTPPAAGSARAPAGHPIVPVVHIGLVQDGAVVPPSFLASTDAIIAAPAGGDASSAAEAWAKGVLETLAAVAAGDKKPISNSAVFFNITRGPTGVST